ncbi:MAG: ASCH domain-containing protein [Acidimicrobiales bacterium]
MKFPVVDGLRTLELGTPGTVREWLNGLVLEGKKQATACTNDEYEDNEKEFIGERLALVNDNLERVGTVEVTGVAEATFGTVPWSFALAEGEGDASIEEWRAGHRRFWTQEGVSVTDDTPVFLVFFKLVDLPTPISSDT